MWCVHVTMATNVSIYQQMEPMTLYYQVVLVSLIFNIKYNKWVSFSKKMKVSIYWQMESMTLYQQAVLVSLIFNTKNNNLVNLPSNWLVGWFYGVYHRFQQYLQLYRGCQFYWWRKLEDSEKTTDLLQVTDKHCHMMLYRVHQWPLLSGVRTHNISGDRHWLHR